MGRIDSVIKPEGDLLPLQQIYFVLNSYDRHDYTSVYIAFTQICTLACQSPNSKEYSLLFRAYLPAVRM